MKTYEERRTNGTGFAIFGGFRRVTVERGMDLRTMKPRAATVNWACVGPVSPADARRFAADLMEAIECAEAWNGTR